jgi:hypothetical protein
MHIADGFVDDGAGIVDARIRQVGVDIGYLGIPGVARISGR